MTEGDDQETAEDQETAGGAAGPEFRASDAMHHEGTICPVCGQAAVCGHPVKYPPIPSWQPNVWVKGP